MVYLAAPCPSGNFGISEKRFCILGICIFIFQHNLLYIWSKTQFVSLKGLGFSEFSHPCIRILILLSSLHILRTIPSFPLSTFSSSVEGVASHLQPHWQSKHQKKKTISLFIFSFSSSPIYFQAGCHYFLIHHCNVQCALCAVHCLDTVKGKVSSHYYFESEVFKMRQNQHLQLPFAQRCRLEHS